MVLTKYEIKELIEKEQMITNFIDLDKQLNDHGFDVTVDKVFKFSTYAVIDFDNILRRLPRYKEIKFNKIKIEGKEVEVVWLDEGYYLVEINEILKLPKNVCAIVLPRSTLIKSGIHLCSGLWDAGYEGKGKLMLIVGNRCIITKNARIGQMVFFKLTREVEGYKGIYQKEGLKL